MPFCQVSLAKVRLPTIDLTEDNGVKIVLTKLAMGNDSKYFVLYESIIGAFF
jgi:hypothetical protein